MLKVLDINFMRNGYSQWSYEEITQKEFMQVGAQQYPFYPKVTGQAQVQQPGLTQIFSFGPKPGMDGTSNGG
jgi:hypothetical protein